MTVFEAKYAILRYFKGDSEKALKWWDSDNPNLGGFSPHMMVHIGRSKRLCRWIDRQLKENMRSKCRIKSI